MPTPASHVYVVTPRRASTSSRCARGRVSHDKRNPPGLQSQRAPPLRPLRAASVATQSVRGKAAESSGSEWSARCVVTEDGRHEPRVTGYHSGPRPGVECEKPLHVQCRRCRAETTWQCQNHRESRCKPCANRYRRRLTRIADAGMRKRDGRGQMGMLTLTAPSDGEHLRWVPGGRATTPCGCDQRLAEGLGAWNVSASARWNVLRTALRREYPELVFLRAVEVQKRGALHLHVIVWVPGGWHLGMVQRLALRAGFGCVIDWAPCEPGSRRAAYYVAKYVTKATDQRDECPWEVDEVDRETGELQRRQVPARYRTWSASREWGLTMRQIREVCRQAAERQTAVARATAGSGPAPDEEDRPDGPHAERGPPGRTASPARSH